MRQSIRGFFESVTTFFVYSMGYKEITAKTPSGQDLRALSAKDYVRFAAPRFTVL